MQTELTAINEDMNEMNVMYVFGKVLQDSTIIESIFSFEDQKGYLIVKNPDGEILKTDDYYHYNTNTMYFPCIDETVKRSFTLLPSSYIACPDPIVLKDQIAGFITKYLEIEPTYIEITARYILMSWVYDMFQRIPYLRILGNWGTGKNRFLDIVGGLTYHTIRLGVNVTAANIFRALDQNPGTLVMDEVVINKQNYDIISVLNAGYDRNSAIRRNRQSKNGYVSEFFNVFGPKVMACRRNFNDDALESRFLTIYSKEMTRNDIPRNLQPYNAWNEISELRNQLLGFRLEYRNRIDPNLPIIGTEDYLPRITEIISPILLVMGENNVSDPIIGFINQQNDERIAMMGLGEDGDVAQALIDLHQAGKQTPTMQEIADLANGRRKNEYPLQPRRVGSIIHGYGISTRRIGRGIVSLATNDQLEQLANRFGIPMEANNK